MNNVNKRNFLASLVFLFSSYLALGVYDRQVTFDMMGVSFLLAGVYGLVCVMKKADFLYPQTAQRFKNSSL